MSTAVGKEDRAGRILIIDDLRENRLLLALHLRAKQYELLEAADGLEGLHIARREQPDLILLDVMMPRMNGYEVCQALKSDPLTQDIPIIIVSALRDASSRVQGIEAGADEFLSRPHDRDELLVRVRSLIQLRRTRMALQREHDKLRLLYNVSQTIMGHLDLEQIMAAMVKAMEAFWIEARANIFLLDEAGRVTHKLLAPYRSPIPANKLASIVMAEGFAGWVVHHRRGDIIADVDADDRWVRLPGQPDTVRAAMAVPLAKAGQVIGLITLTHPRPGYFEPEHMDLLQAIAGQAATVIQNARYFQEINEKQRKLEALLSQSTDAVITTDEEYAVTRVNHAAETLLSLREGEIIGRPLSDIPQLNWLLPLFEQAHSLPVTEEVALEKGRIVVSSVSLVQDVGYLVVVQDITKLKAVEQQRLEIERREKLRLRETFGRYVSPRLAEHILADNPAILARRERRQAVVLFADLRNFTQMLSNMPAGEAIELLNEFFDNMTEVVYTNEGTIFDLIGDELEVGFNVPLDQPDAAQRAVKTAIAMQARFDQLEREWSRRADTRLGLGIGLDMGDVLIGNVGARTHMNYAMVGRVVNTAHRLVELAGNGQILLSPQVYATVVQSPGLLAEQIQCRPLGPVKIKGIAEPQMIYLVESKSTFAGLIPA